MKPFIVISCLVLVAMAKPQGYSYNSPAPELSVALLPPHVSSHSQSLSVSFRTIIFYSSISKRNLLLSAIFIKNQKRIMWWYYLEFKRCAINTTLQIVLIQKWILRKFSFSNIWAIQNNLRNFMKTNAYISQAPSFSHGLASSHGSLGLAAHSTGGSLSLGSSYSVAPSSSYSSFNNAPSAPTLLAPGRIQ